LPILKEGQIIRDTYQVERFLGEGAFAEVFRVQHRFLGRQAMKVLKVAGKTLKEIESLLGEASLLSRIGHPNIVRVFDANILETSEGQFGFYTMEYVAGGTLDRFWQSYRNKKIPIADCVDILKQVCSGIAVAHAEKPPIIHRDIKPQNILVGYDGAGIRIRVSDFGLAKTVNPQTLLASACGTLSFKPPESFENQDSTAADVWALGTIFYLLLTDKLPYPKLEERDISDASHFLQPLRKASIYNILIDPKLDEILLRCLSKNVRERYADACDLLNDLKNWQPTQGSHLSESSKSEKGFEDKSALGLKRTSNMDSAKQMIERAKIMAKNPGQLISAADLLEEAINKSPEYRNQYESQLLLWRRGICM
jgi:eukaryotic-like serine/threonine-protein kinase